MAEPESLGPRQRWQLLAPVFAVLVLVVPVLAGRLYWLAKRSLSRRDRAVRPGSRRVQGLRSSRVLVSRLPASVSQLLGVSRLRLELLSGFWVSSYRSP